MRERLQQLYVALRHDERGAALAEYALLVALIAVVAVTIIATLGGDIVSAFTNVDNAIQNANNQNTTTVPAP